MAPRRDEPYEPCEPAEPAFRAQPAFRAAGPPPGPVDWWGWQARVRLAADGVPRRTRPVLAARTGVRASSPVRLVLGTTAAVGLVAAGLVATGVLDRAAPRARVDGFAIASPTRAGASTSVPLELVGVSDLPPPPAPEPAPPPEPEPVAPAPQAPFPVAGFTVDLVDPDRPPVPRGDAAAAPGRLLRTEVRLPDAPDAGPFPLVVFAHGYATRTAAYAPLLDGLAAAGYVVVAPELPVTSTAHGPAVGGREPIVQVDDLAFVLTSVETLAGAGGPLAGRVVPGPVAVMGHSDGGISAAAIAFSGARRDGRVGAAVVLSGARADDGAPWFPSGSPALLAVHGDADTVNPFASSQSLYVNDRSGSPRVLVRVVGGGHTDAFVGARTRPALVVLIDDFLRAHLAGDAAAAARVAADASVPGVLELLGA